MVTFFKQETIKSIFPFPFTVWWIISYCFFSFIQHMIASMKYILVTGGVISGIGKGIIASSVGTILKSCGLHVTAIKIDPYINIDAGTFSPYEHGNLTQLIIEALSTSETVLQLNITVHIGWFTNLDYKWLKLAIKETICSLNSSIAIIIWTNPETLIITMHTMDSSMHLKWTRFCDCQPLLFR